MTSVVDIARDGMNNPTWTPWERAFAFGLLKRIESGATPTAKQAATFERILANKKCSENRNTTPENGTNGTERLARDRESEQCSVPIPVPISPKHVPIYHPDAGKPKAIHRVKRGHYEVGAEIVAALMWGPKTWQQVEEQAGLTGNTSVKWMHSLHESGVIRISGYTPPAVQHKPARIWSLQTSPFALPDEVKA